MFSFSCMNNPTGLALIGTSLGWLNIVFTCNRWEFLVQVLTFGHGNYELFHFGPKPLSSGNYTWSYINILKILLLTWEILVVMKRSSSDFSPMVRDLVVEWNYLINYYIILFQLYNNFPMLCVIWFFVECWNHKLEICLSGNLLYDKR